MLIDQNGHINSDEQFMLSTEWGCSKKFNIYLLYSARPKDESANYTIHIDIFDKRTLTYHASSQLPIPFLFLPVNRVTAILRIPFERAPSPTTCNLTCSHGGQCMKYTNVDQFFCRCLSNWSGAYCDIPVDCRDCSNGSLCVGSSNNRTICVCPENRIGPRCLIPSVCGADQCVNDGQCVSFQSDVDGHRQFCLCPDQFDGFSCEDKKQKFEIVFHHLESPSYIVIYIRTQKMEEPSLVKFLIKKLTHNQRMISLYIGEIIDVAFVKFPDSYYLAMTRQVPAGDDYISTSISPTQRCPSIDELFNASLLALPRVQRVKYYHRVCQTRSDLWCFFDEVYMCVCTVDDHANCFEFDHHVSFACQQNDFCQNDAQCFQDDVTCPSSTICIRDECYFGTRCQFYAKGFGLTLDDILRYEIRRNSTLSQQTVTIKVSAIVTMIMFSLGLISGILALLTFSRKRCQQVGCGLYLFASSITSILVMAMFIVKFWFLILSQIDFIDDRTILRLGCKSIEFGLKSLLYTDTWLNGCVAIERAYALFVGIKFDRARSKRIAKGVVFMLPMLIMITVIHEPLYRDLHDDEEERRTWCVTYYSRALQNYNSTITLLHFLITFVLNLCSACFIILMTARQRSVSQSRVSYKQHLLKQLLEHKQILISPVALVILSLPRLILSLLSTCMKSSREPWLYLVGNFISFVPSMGMFVIFVVPSDLYSKEFRQAIKSSRRGM